jgi:hypothetical protein
MAKRRRKLAPRGVDEQATGATKEPTIEVDIRRLTRWVLTVAIGIELLLVVGDIVMNRMALVDIGAVRRFWNIAREDGVATWFGATQTWTVGLTALLLYLVQRHEDRPRWRRVGWLVIGIVLLYMAMDDGSEFHERVGTAIKETWGDPDAETGGLVGFPSYAWQVVFGPLLALFGGFVLVFVFAEMRAGGDRALVVVAVALLGTAVALDFMEGLDIDSSLNLQGYLVRNLDWVEDSVRHYFKSLEEFLEMLAMTLLWVALLRHLARVSPRFAVRVSGPS